MLKLKLLIGLRIIVGTNGMTKTHTLHQQLNIKIFLKLTNRFSIVMVEERIDTYWQIMDSVQNIINTTVWPLEYGLILIKSSNSRMGQIINNQLQKHQSLRNLQNRLKKKIQTIMMMKKNLKRRKKRMKIKFQRKFVLKYIKFEKMFLRISEHHLCKRKNNK